MRSDRGDDAAEDWDLQQGVNTALLLALWWRFVCVVVSLWLAVVFLSGLRSQEVERRVILLGGEDEENVECCICLQRVARGARLLPCQHRDFCHPCVLDLAVATHSPRCPLCRATLTTTLF